MKNNMNLKSITRVFLLFALISLIAFPTFQSADAQVYKENIMYADTVGNSQTITKYATILHGYSDVDKYYYQTDSLMLRLVALGEIDIDQLIVTKGYYIGSTFYAVATPDTTTLTINNAASTTTVVISLPTENGCTDLEYYNAVRVVVVSASSGNDSSDPNKLTLYEKRFITRKNAFGLY